jgi:hypothetical protein
VSEHGIEANPEKISTIINIEPFKNLYMEPKSSQEAMISSFISCLGEHGMLLYKLLKKSEQFKWTEEAQQALDQTKSFLAMP